jgi:predicted TIM-barrel fold metal-dependent hydrolase
MGVTRQLLFPSGPGLFGMVVYGSPKEGDNYGIARYGISEEKLESHACDLMHAQNEWAVEVARISPRCRPVTGVYGGSPDELCAVTKALIDRGIRAVQLCVARLPGGVSPGSNELDHFYAMLAEANVALTLHIGGESLFFRTTGWNKAKAFEGFKGTSELLLNPWNLSTFHIPPQNFIGTMVAGGVFDRHPTLRVGTMEYCAHWIGPLARLLDIWHANNQSLHPQLFADGTEGRRLPMRPSEYISRNVRVAPFDFEPVGEYIDMYGLEDVYCFATDYPHVEGGKRAVDKFAASLESLGPRVMEKFFVTNGELLLPA